MKTRTMITTMFAALLSIATCDAQTVIKNQSSNDNGFSIVHGIDGHYDFVDDGPTIERNLNLKNFKAIQNKFAAQIYYTHSSRYSVKVVGSEKGIDVMAFTVKDGTLYIKLKENFEGKSFKIQKGIKIYISSPDLESISNSGSLTLQADNWNQNSLDVDNHGSLTLQADNWKLNGLKVDNHGSFTMKVKALDCQTLDISNHGSFQYKQGNVEAANVSISNHGSSQFSGKVKANSYTEDCHGSVNEEVDIIADKLDLSITGSGNVNNTFKGKTASIFGSGSPHVTVNVDCDNLSIYSGGVSSITVKGNAKGISQDCARTAEINTQGLKLGL